MPQQSSRAKAFQWHCRYNYDNQSAAHQWLWLIAYTWLINLLPSPLQLSFRDNRNRLLLLIMLLRAHLELTEHV